ncbi:MAG: polysaccharide pyruvyl transferase family protein [Saprospiraceae bacterium]|nr:polysaccharide pyruvyl transferase family protein [Saprospiraceae bacterium]
MERRIFIKKSSSLTIGAGYFATLRSIIDDAARHRRKNLLLCSSWQTINIGDIAHTPGVLALCEKYLPDVDVTLWPSDVGRGVKEMLMNRFPKLTILDPQETTSISSAFEKADFLLHGSGPYLVGTRKLVQWVRETGKPYGVYGISLPKEKATEQVIELLNGANFVFFRDSVSLEFAKELDLKVPIKEFGPDGAFAVDVRNDQAAETFIRKHDLSVGQFFCVIPRYRKTPEWRIPSKKKPVDHQWEKIIEEQATVDLKPYREAITRVIRETPMKVLICPEDMTQMRLGKEHLYDPLPEDVKKRVVLREEFWLTDEALSTYIRSAGLFGLEMHSPIMCIGNGVPALVGRFKEQTTKGFMWKDIGLSEWLFDSDTTFDLEQLIPTILWLANHPTAAKKKAAEAQRIVQRRQSQTMQVLRNELYA